MHTSGKAVLPAAHWPRLSSRWREYAQLVRLPTVFTALADIGLGWCGALATGTPWARWPTFAALLAASACLYSAGMIWNDFFDVDQDRRERPSRPLPSGRISRRGAATAGLVQLCLGLLFAAWAGLRTGGYDGTPIGLATLVILAVLLYDGGLKRTWLGPVGMGACRFLNVLLGLSAADPARFPWGARVYLALVVGLYIVGVTWFARTEARTSSPTALTAAAWVMLAALGLALVVPVWLDTTNSSVFFPYLLVGLGFLVGIPIGRAIHEPTPMRVQAAVKRALVGLVVLDAALACALIGTPGLVLLVLLLPVLYLGRWIYVT
jgi:4-hydroxybenzoate polyprenyltransferase